MEIEELFSREPIKLTEVVQTTEVEKPFIDNTKDQAFNADRALRTVFVGNVPVNANKNSLVKIFRPFGKIEKVWIRSVPVEQESRMPTKAKVITKSLISTVKSKSLYVLFAEKESVGKMTSGLNGTLFEGRHLHVTAASHIDRDFKSTLFVGNVPFDVDEEDLRAHFAQCGDIDYVRVVRDRLTWKSQGFAYVKYKTLESANEGIKLDGKEFQTRALRVYKARKRFGREQTNNSETRESRQQSNVSGGKKQVRFPNLAAKPGLNKRPFNSAPSSKPQSDRPSFNPNKRPESKGQKDSRDPRAFKKISKFEGKSGSAFKKVEAKKAAVESAVVEKKMKRSKLRKLAEKEAASKAQSS